MRRYDEPIEVRQGLVSGVEAPEQFLWRDKLWVVREIVGHWIETGAWWQQRGVAELLGVGGGSGASGGGQDARLGADLLDEREVWRVSADQGRYGRLRGRRSSVQAEDDEDVQPGFGVFDLAFDWGGGRWRLVSSID